jgi:uncharacterized membrane protein (DUF106 family)
MSASSRPKAASRSARPLPSREDEADADQHPKDAPPEEEELEEEIDEEGEKPPETRKPAFRATTFVYTFLFLLGIFMIFDTNTRTGVANLFGVFLNPSIAFGGQYLLLTMFVAAAVEMALTAVAYNWATDWVKAARVQKWSQAFRKVQMQALRSGKKDRIAALKEHQMTLTRLSGEVSMAQLKGMAVTWFLVIAVYTWVGLLLTGHQIGKISDAVNMGGASVSLLQPIGPIPIWFLVFSLYTVPLSLVFRRILKHYSLRRYAQNRGLLGGTVTGSASTPSDVGG